MTKLPLRNSILAAAAAASVMTTPAYAHNGAAKDVGNVLGFFSLFCDVVRVGEAVRPAVAAAASFGKHAPRSAKKPQP